MKPAERALLWLSVGLAAIGLAAAIYTTSQIGALRRELTGQRQRVEQSTEAMGRLQRELRALGTEVKLFFIEETPTTLRLVPETRRVLSADLPIAVMHELIKGPRPGSKLRPSVPAETVLNGVRVRNGVAYVDVSGGITRLNLGSEGEAAVVGSIVKTLTALPGIKQVQILVNGAMVESLAGHVDVSVPLSPRDF